MYPEPDPFLTPSVLQPKPKPKPTLCGSQIPATAPAASSLLSSFPGSSPVFSQPSSQRDAVRNLSHIMSVLSQNPPMTSLSQHKRPSLTLSPVTLSIAYSAPAILASLFLKQHRSALRPFYFSFRGQVFQAEHASFRSLLKSHFANTQNGNNEKDGHNPVIAGTWRNLNSHTWLARV